MADCNFILAIGLHAQSLILSKIQLTILYAFVWGKNNSEG